MFQRKSKPTPEELAMHKKREVETAKKELRRQEMERRRTCEQIKGEIDRSRAEATKSREEAMRALEAGDELEAKRLCSIINIQNTAIARKTKLYQINLKAMELVAQKAIFLDTVLPEIIPANLDDLIDDADLSELQKQLERLDVDLELMSDRLEESTSAVGANDVFEELVGEIRRQREIDTVDDLYPVNEPLSETEEFKVNRHF